MARPRLSFPQLFNMSFGFLGIQFGWGLQLANMSAIYERLGARSDQVPGLWLAAPMTGLLVQPIIGALSDRTWGRLGRRRPYFLTGAILASAALFVMPTSSSILMAASLLWVLDASINISMEPFRAFVADKLDASQRTAGFVMQSLMIGIGASLANALPFIFGKLGVTGSTASGIPLSVKYSFQLGAVVFILAVIWTVVTTGEHPPEDMAAFERARRESRGIGPLFGEIVDAVRDMPATMKQLAVVQFVTWLGLFCMWLFFVPAVARHVFGATDAQSASYTQGVEWGGFAMAFYSITCFLVALVLPRVAAATSRKAVHAGALVCGGLGLLSVYVIHNQYLLLLSMAAVGVAWASILSMPYAILSGALPAQRMGVYMGVFNFFIVTPEIIASLFFGPMTRALFGRDNPNAPLYVVMIGGFCFFVAALLVARVQDVGTREAAAEIEADAHEPLTVQGSAQPVPSGGPG
ncbi:major facilitator superfamily MFS_1 (plasmid) [Gemmatirosa kalamazoonensis]|uniref:Major facilitator superfamily MFS_1 n=1 Tax=Gemmatirosa kalamazoonensis TaxID=861299 RepID=W0RSZ2_9BACT|nr:MFS transporter [Gemmatirosa kalamazoonensis]AHG93801.1 major facilitator superfamily MFS_1 [Gemmatirosa kalamazoonensis]